MPPMRVVPALDELKHGQAGFSMIPEPAPIQELAFERGKEALGHGVVIAVAHRTHLRDDPDLPAALTKRQRRVRRAMVRVIDHPL